MAQEVVNGHAGTFADSAPNCMVMLQLAGVLGYELRLKVSKDRDGSVSEPRTHHIHLFEGKKLVTTFSGPNLYWAIDQMEAWLNALKITATLPAGMEGKDVVNGDRG